MLASLLSNIAHNLFKPLLLFFYLGFLIPLLKVPFETPPALYQSLTLYLLLAIGWHGGEELASLPAHELFQATSLMGIGFFTNLILGILSFLFLRRFTRLRDLDAAVVASYYGSDSAGTFVTCLGVLSAASIPFAPYMPVLLAVMEIPGCLLMLFFLQHLRKKGLDTRGFCPGEDGFDPDQLEEAPEGSPFDPELMREVFLSPGLFLLFGGIVIGYVSKLQGASVVRPFDMLFVDLFQSILCLFLLEMGITASRQLTDLKQAGASFIAFGILAPNALATIGIFAMHFHSWWLGHTHELGSYVLFSVLCAAASYIAAPAIQRMAVPQASPTLPLAASLGLTFTYNVTIGIPVYIEISRWVIATFPILPATVS